MSTDAESLSTGAESLTKDAESLSRDAETLTTNADEGSDCLETVLKPRESTSAIPEGRSLLRQPLFALPESSSETSDTVTDALETLVEDEG